MLQYFCLRPDHRRGSPQATALPVIHCATIFPAASPSSTSASCPCLPTVRTNGEETGFLLYCNYIDALPQTASPVDAANDTSTWFAPAGAVASRVTLSSELAVPEQGLNYSIYNISGPPPLIPGGSFVVVTRGTHASTDVAADVYLWHEAALFQMITNVGPYGSFPVSAQQAFVGVLSRVSEFFTDGAEEAYYRGLLEAVNGIIRLAPRGKAQVRRRCEFSARRISVGVPVPDATNIRPLPPYPCPGGNFRWSSQATHWVAA